MESKSSTKKPVKKKSTRLIKIKRVPDSEKDFLALFSADCVGCGYLVDSMPRPKPLPACHYMRGNKHCPAEGVKLVVVGKAISYAERLHKARLARDTKEELEVLRLVETKSKAFKSVFYTHLDKL